nr:hypothetical protein [Tanacetum cinerariifolium]
MSIQDIKDLKQQYLDEMKIMINQNQIEDYRNERIDIHYKRECKIKIDELKKNFNGMSIEINKKKELQQLEQATNLTLFKKESNELIKSSVEDFVPILSESKDTSGSDSECDLSSCDDSSPINILDEKTVTFSNPLFDSNDDFTSSDDESLSDVDVPEDNVKIYLNPLFEFNDEYISSDVNPLFEEVLENIENKDSYDFNLDEPGGDIDEIDAFLEIDVSTDIKDGYYNSKGDIIYLENLLTYDTIPSLLPEMFLDHDSKGLKDEPNDDDLKYMVKNFDLGIHEKFFSPTYVSLPFEDRHYLFFTYVI